MRVIVRFVWGAFVSCCFACGCVLELFVCRVRAGSPNRPQDQAGARWHIALSGGIDSWRDAWCVVIDRPVFRYVQGYVYVSITSELTVLSR